MEPIRIEVERVDRVGVVQLALRALVRLNIATDERSDREGRVLADDILYFSAIALGGVKGHP
jgi:hypothetical protein